MDSYTAPESSAHYQHTAKVVFQMWAYKFTMEVQIGGNTTGLSIINAAVHAAVDKLCENEEEIRFTDPDDNTLVMEKDEDDLADCVVRVEILNAERKKTPV